MKDIMIIERILPKYRKDIMDLLHDRMDFLFLHSKHANGVKQVTAPYSRQMGSFQFASKESNLFLNAFPAIFKYRPKLIVYEYSIGIASLYPTYLLARLLGIKFVLWGHGYDHHKGFHPERSRADQLRLYVARKADAVIFYGTVAQKKFAEYLPEEKLFVAFNCLNTRMLSAIRDGLEEEGREQVKARLGFAHRYNLIFIGRILDFKKPELLIGIYEQLKAQYGSSLGLHFVGDGPYLTTLQAMAAEKGIENKVVFHGAIHDDQKTGELLFASDLMIMPGYVGLSVNHAFNFDCPVVTFQQKENGPFHSPEIEYLVDGQTGFIVEEHRVEALADTIRKYLANPLKQQEMKSNIRSMVEHTCSVDNFMQGYQDAIVYALDGSKETNYKNEATQTEDLTYSSTSTAGSRSKPDEPAHR